MGMYDTTIGTLLVGIFFNTFLYGLVTYQFALYHATKFDDPPSTRYMVLFLFLLDTFHSVSVIYMAWSYVVTNYGNPAILAVVNWPHTLTPLETALAALVTQIYLGSRIRRLTSSKVLYAVVILLAIPSFVLAAVSSAKASIIRVLSGLHQITPFAVSWLSLQVVVDMFISITFVIVLSRSRTGFSQTDTILNRFIRGAIQTGFFAGVFSVANLVTFVVYPDTNLYTMFAISHGRIYTNTLLDTLLARELLTGNVDSEGALTQRVQFDSVFWTPGDTQAVATFQQTGMEFKV